MFTVTEEVTQPDFEDVKIKRSRLHRRAESCDPAAMHYFNKSSNIDQEKSQIGFKSAGMSKQGSMTKISQQFLRSSNHVTEGRSSHLDRLIKKKLNSMDNIPIIGEHTFIKERRKDAAGRFKVQVTHFD